MILVLRQSIFSFSDSKKFIRFRYHLNIVDCFFKNFINVYMYVFIYLWLCWVLVAALRLSLVAASRGYSSLWCAGFSLQWLLLLWSTGSRRVGFSSCVMGSVVVAHGLSCSAACGTFPNQGSNLCPLHWQADS